MGSKVVFPSNGSTCEGYLAVPESGSGPGVIVIQEWWGLVGHITDVTDRFAEAGFVALAPDLYHGVETTEPDEAQRLLMGLAMDVAAADISGAARYLKSLPSNSSEKVGTVGFCMGGSLALWSATLAPQVAATVAFYPGLPWERMAPKWQNYQGKHAMIHCSESDGTSSDPGIQLAKTSIEGAGGQVQLFDYPGTHHAFFNSDRPEVFDAASSELAWDRTLEFFRTHLA
ncbi:MAG TPA: dienelactone hydrolase family protein [Candidatus Nanopelagicaceae bacterium]|nr:dienelactone hydrolase family protein [Candidatus Nanopelagicaceae bacterium]